MMSREQYLFLKLMEESNEIAHISSKIIQFGVHEKHPDQDKSNHQRLREEIMDAVAIVVLLFNDGLIEDFTDHELYAHVSMKRDKVAKYLAISQSLNRVQPNA